jgi:hypothetical protein
VIDHRSADEGSVSGDDIEDPGGEACFPGVLGELEHRERGVGGGLENDRVSAGQRGSDLPDGEHQRKVPGGDRADHAHRLAEGVGERSGRDRNRLAGDLARPSGEVIEAFGGGGRIDKLRLEDRLAVVESLDAPDLRGAGGQQVRDLPEDLRPVARLHLLPLGARLELCAGRLHRAVDVFRRGRRHVRQLFLGRGVDRLVSLSFPRILELAVDEQSGLQIGGLGFGSHHSLLWLSQRPVKSGFRFSR